LNNEVEFIITIDTEGDNQWDHGRALTVENIRYVPRFQNLCDQYQIKPTYLVTSEICDDDFSKEIFSEYLSKNKVEIGAHLHSWTTPPYMDKEGYRFNDKNHAFAFELPEKLIKEKIKNITDSIEVSFGQRPFSFRSGRFGFNENIARVLVENSYMVDSSVTPYINWYKHKGIPNGIGGPDYLNNTAFPCRYDFNEKSLLEIPITILPTKFPLNKNENIAQYYFSHLDTNILFKTLRKILFQNQPVWLRPYPFMNIKLYRELLNEAIKRDLPYIVMMFHSSELMPGCSKYRPDADSVEKLFEELQTLFSMLRSKNIRSVTLTEAAKKVLL